ncbi:MAG TPA: DUF4235 domain-containing protein [Trebonia sp.]|jgi:hypothetical protein|nr:DUF4235 domain-containing protein [Trebonia sp.]
MIKLVYKPVSILVSVLGGIIAGAIFKRVWKLAAHEDEAPKATDIRRSYPEVLIAATIQGAIFALVKAALDRGAAQATLRLTGFWPGEDSEPEEPRE